MKKRINRIIVASLAAILMIMPISTFAASFSPSLSEVAPTNNGRKDNVRPFTNKGYLDTQGVAFDIYSKKDGYAFNKGTESSTKNYFQLVHFTTKGTKITKKKYVKYSVKNVGHANDATIFRAKGNKYLLFAVSGGKEKSSKTSDGKTCKLGVIWLDEYNKGTAKVRACNIKKKDDVRMVRSIEEAQFSGITYTGMRKVDGEKRPVFVIKDGANFYAAYFTVNDSREITLTIYDRGRINKPNITGSIPASTQGVTYHNNYLYIPYSGEGNETTYRNMMIGRIKYKTLFDGTKGSTAKNLSVYRNKFTKAKVAVGKKKVKMNLEKYIPEAIFFKTLNGKGLMYMAVNRGTTDSRIKDIDIVVKSKQKY